jgi:hypothetical protein
VTEATLENGPLWVLPGSQREPVHAVEPDRRPHAQYGYVEITDHDTSAAVPVLLQPGDLLVFHGHLLHKSTDNRSSGMRAAMVYHYGEAGTVDRTLDQKVTRSTTGSPARRACGAVGGDAEAAADCAAGSDHAVSLRVRDSRRRCASTPRCSDGSVERRIDALWSVSCRALGASLIDLVPVDGGRRLEARRRI